MSSERTADDELDSGALHPGGCVRSRSAFATRHCTGPAYLGPFRCTFQPFGSKSADSRLPSDYKGPYR